MRYRLAALTLFVVLPVMNVLAAPAPDPYAILDIGPPPKGQTAEEYCKWHIDSLPNLCGYHARHDPEMKKLPSVTQEKAPWLWLEKNLRVTPESGGRRLRLTFRAGTRTEQVVILNAFLRVYFRMVVAKRIQSREEGIRIMEAGNPRLAKDIKETRNPNSLQRYLQHWENGKVAEADFRAEIARLKQVAVTRWAK